MNELSSVIVNQPHQADCDSISFGLLSQKQETHTQEVLKTLCVVLCESEILMKKNDDETQEVCSKATREKEDVGIFFVCFGVRT